LTPQGLGAALLFILLVVEISMSAELPTTTRLVIDFRDPTQAQGWTSVDDQVMGGVSASQVQATPAGLIFRGEVSLANNGGFASIRALPRDYGLAGATALILRLQGDGQTYKFGIRTDEAFDGVQYQARVPTQAGEWLEVPLPLSAFQPSYRGRPVPAPPLDPARIRVFGLPHRRPPGRTLPASGGITTGGVLRAGPP
jgi:NADH dehydrogenase [ubiquinone] 1 alpha subcomplex assembly factor 1